MNQITRQGLRETATHEQITPAGPVQKIAVGRRGFLSTSAAAGGGLLLGLSLTRPAAARTKTPTPTPTPTPTATPTLLTPPPATVGATYTVDIFVVIGADNTVTIVTPGGEMGQGINAGLAQVLSEELPLDWTKLKTISAPYSPAILGVGMGEVTGGSNGMRSWFNPMLQAGATAREMLLAAARAAYPSAKTPLKAMAGVVQDANGVLVATYGQLAQAAAAITLGSPAPILSTPATYKVIGQKMLRPDIWKKVDGSAVFGIDVHPNNTPSPLLAGMVFATVKHCPTIGGTVKTVGAAPAGSQVVNLGTGIAVTGPTTWKAQQNANAVQVSWNLPTSTVLATTDTTKLATTAQTLMTSGTPATAESVGDLAGGFAAATRTLNLTYSLPFLAHACMEVLCCTVALTRDASNNVTACTVWAPTQAPDWVAGTVAALIPSLQLPGGSGAPDPSKITVNVTFMGGGAGRKIEQDYIAEAVKTALGLSKPVKLTWFREEDFAHDVYRPSALSQVKVGLDASGKITAWSNRIVAPSVLAQKGWMPFGTPDSVSIGSATGVGPGNPEGLRYPMGARLVEYIALPTAVPLGFWRSVGQSISCFVVESAIDECAIAAGVDPYQYRRTLLAGQTSALAVLDAAAGLAKWSTPPATGHARGIALSPGFGSLVATVAELALVTTTTTSPTTGLTTTTTSYKVVSVCVAIDCGFAVNPLTVEAQVQSAIVFGLSAALHGAITFKDGRVEQSNFHDYRVLRMNEMPKVEVHIVPTPERPTGVGEPGTPPIAPALANALFALTGKRIRRLPIAAEDLKA